MSSSPHVANVGEAEFLEQVIARSRDQPVLVDAHVEHRASQAGGVGVERDRAAAEP